MASGSRTVIVTRMSLHCQTCCQGRNTGTPARRGGGDGGGSPPVLRGVDAVGWIAALVIGAAVRPPLIGSRDRWHARSSTR